MKIQLVSAGFCSLTMNKIPGSICWKFVYQTSGFGVHFKSINETLTPKLQPKQNTWKMSENPQTQHSKIKLKYYIKNDGKW